MEKHAILFKYSFGYAWACMIHDEEILTTHSTNTSRFSFDIDTAHELPKFMTLVTDPHQNPYITLLVDIKDINISNNLFSLYGIADTKYYGTCSSKEFISRSRLFISGDENIDLFDGLYWTKFALSGSIITACAPNFSPLMEKLKKVTETNNERNRSKFQETNIAIS
jgi:hypothetical protein